MLRSTAVCFSCLLLVACSLEPSTAKQQDIRSFYDYQLYTPKSQAISIHALPESLTNADVILVGEWHTHAAIHRFQTDLLKQRFVATPNLTLSMEQFTRDKQSVINDYLNGEIGEQTLINDAQGWPNYQSDYRALVEFAKANSLDVLAANAPKQIVRCIAQQGVTYVAKLGPLERSYLARNIETGPSAYKDKFMASMHHGNRQQTERQYAAQITWDETMAETITDYLSLNPEHQVIHIAGKFHTEQGLGVKASILNRMPELRVVVITPTHQPNSIDVNNSDFLLHVLAPPMRYIKMENRMTAYQHLAKRSEQSDCM